MMHTGRRHNIPPSPRGFPLVGVLPRAWQDPLQYLLDAASQYGPWVAVMSEMITTMLERWRPLAAHGHPLDMAAEMTALTQRMMGMTLFRTDLFDRATASA
jgi:hypothetical protein